MDKSYAKIIYILIIIILILFCILIYKIERTPKYDENLYEYVYKEYDELSIISSENSETNDINLYENYDNNDLCYSNSNTTNSLKFIVAILNIPKINISYPVINEYTESNLNIAPTKLVGPEPNSIGNFVIIGHNNWNNQFFSRLHILEKGDIVRLTDFSGKKVIYKVEDKYEIKEDDFSCLDQNTNQQIELTLITCIRYKKDKRLIIKCLPT